MLNLLIVAGVCLFVVEAAHCEPLVFHETHLPCHRLPLNVRPTHYKVELKLPSLDSEEYEGRVSITVKFVESKQLEPGAKRTGHENDIEKSVKGVNCSLEGVADEIVLHADEQLDIQDIKVRSEAHLGFLFNGTKKNREIVKLLRDRNKQMIAIKLKRGVYPGTSGKITIAFKGKIRTDKRGLYVSTYKDGQQVYRHIVSQFQPTDARTVFPCFDEPRFKVPFSVKLSHPQNLVAYGNMEVKSVVTDDGNSLATTTFARTPRMPVHMVAFIVGEFDKPLEVESHLKHNWSSSTRKIRVITTPGKRNAGQFALQVAKKSLEWFESYIDFKFPLDKLDVIAIADHDKPNAESWGLVFVRDNLLWVDDETKPDTEITTAFNVAHVVVHQWFANLVSASWWTDLWITEGVAAQFAFRIVQDLFQPADTEYFFRLAILTGVMQADQWGTLHALSPQPEYLQTSDQIGAIFDTLAFMKSASLAEMVSDSVGAVRYQKTLRSLVADHAYGSINSYDYLRALRNSGEKRVEEAFRMIRTFVAFEGVPLLEVAASDTPSSHLILRLGPFDEADEMSTSGVDPRAHEFTIFTRVNVLDKPLAIHVNSGQILRIFLPPYSNQSISECLVHVNPRSPLSAYYRVRYTDEIYSRLKVAIMEKHVAPLNRLQILDDANNLVQAQLITNETFKSLLDSYANEDDPAVIIEMLVASRTLSRLTTSDTKPSPISGAFLNLFRNFGFQFSETDSLIMQRARQVTLTTLIKQGNQEVTAAALRAFERAHGDVVLFLREPVYTALVLSRSSQVEKLFEKLDQTKSHEERMRLVSALALSSDKQVLQRVQAWLESSDLKAGVVSNFSKTIAVKLA